MKFLIDEDVPLKILKFLKGLGHDAIRTIPSTTDPELAKLAKREERILISIDKDFTNTRLYPPEDFDIIHVQIHPPYADKIVESLKRLFDELSEKEFKGLIILLESGHIRVK
ncbi:MAG: DUF5615 family PIN-like protein [Chlamydiae bacterium]|nr:DUF5615 family PIN-like protein [Chlamydiota bacterium]MBI3278103.1 DUF5615 family PIN-like protein [Chlamydiota bacterium]